MKVENCCNKIVIKKEFLRNCHSCGHINSGNKEMPKCNKCNKAFLPCNYFQKIHTLKGTDYNDLFEKAYNISPELLLKGLTVIW